MIWAGCGGEVEPTWCPVRVRSPTLSERGDKVSFGLRWPRERRKDRAMYRIREVDAEDDEIADTLAEIHRLTFLASAPLPAFDWGHWWLAHYGGAPVAFAGVVPSTHARNAGYLCRVGVVREHLGHSLQLRLMRAAEVRARNNGWSCIVSDTTDNLASANNFIKAGYCLYRPEYPWAWPNTLYWRKALIRNQVRCAHSPG